MGRLRARRAVRVRSEIIPQKDRPQDVESLQIQKSQVSVPPRCDKDQPARLNKHRSRHTDTPFSE